MSGNPRDVATQLHGGEPRPSGQQIRGSLARARAENPGLLREAARLEADLRASGRLPVTSATFFTASGASRRLVYACGEGRFVITLRRVGAG